MKRILFVCLGNICRSPTAEAVFAHLAEKNKLRHLFEVDSAGIGDWHVGEPAHPRTREVALRRGIVINHIARQIRREDFERFDLIFGMDSGNVSALRRLAQTPEEQAKIKRFRDFDPGASPLERDVPDPYYTGRFEEVFEICERTAQSLLEYLVEQGIHR
ncbi:MAG: low molecular weight phosphotyrosine protein phosphatase [Deltaproteobacteria bacterium]|nr:low molecular weight phosphotyrosine protein phosphatase [Sandaracinaceae bacterium]MCX7807767.1 low molecular weight phosphotyrosine protein phosphatase [Deltaproteobacteria bacterium]MDW8246259.1 low molecular weight protein-tyrosine-phosphatase [Sandaracinaceae bacterium]